MVVLGLETEVDKKRNDANFRVAGQSSKASDKLVGFSPQLWGDFCFRIY